MHPPPKPLQIIAKTLVARFGQSHADAWLAEQLVRIRNPKDLPNLQPASEIAPTTHKIDALGSRLRPLSDILRDNIPAKIGPITTRDGTTSPVKPQVAPLSAAEASQRLIADLEGELSPVAFRLYQALHLVALEVAKARGYHPEVSHVTFHCPLDVVAVALCLHRTTLWRQLGELRERGYLEACPHKTTLRGRIVNDGTLWQVKLHPQRGKRARLSYDELRHVWRDLAADVEVGRTAYRELMQQSYPGEKKLVNHQLLLNWALPPADVKSPLMTVAASQQGDLETVLDLPHAAKRARSAMVDTAAQAICLALGDQSVDFYRLLLWNLLRHHDQGSNYFERVYYMLKRVQIDKKEGFARRAGALLIARLKRSELWEALAETPPNRVGVAPVKA